MSLEQNIHTFETNKLKYEYKDHQLSARFAITSSLTETVHRWEGRTCRNGATKTNTTYKL
jgi:hypothetical protein